jgi:hypothetical protein
LGMSGVLRWCYIAVKSRWRRDLRVLGRICGPIENGATVVATRMSKQSPRAVAGHIRAGVLLMLATLAVVPALVFATHQGATPSLRLTRGFNAPPDKCTFTPPAAVVQSVSRHEPQTPHAHPAASADHSESVPDSPPERAPETRRGPPTDFLI